VIARLLLVVLTLVGCTSSQPAKGTRKVIQSPDSKQTAIVDETVSSVGRVQSRVVVDEVVGGKRRFWVTPVMNGPTQVQWLLFGGKLVVAFENPDFGTNVNVLNKKGMTSHDVCLLSIQLRWTVRCDSPQPTVQAFPSNITADFSSVFQSVSAIPTQLPIP
jgi:hypothetical protein